MKGAPPGADETHREGHKRGVDAGPPDGHGRVLLLENIHPDAATRLSKAGYQVETRAGALDEDELIAAVA